ncbi:hypothetical protein ACFQ1L_07785 [Phytohabitans flavus]|uniref:hypothetical protein n=1 Tax=Phytohabitans flavus TaxID=1076124 RepID=UPI003638F0FE
MGERPDGQRARRGRYVSGAGRRRGTGRGGVFYHGLLVLGQGAILAGLVLGAMVAFIIDKRFWHAAIAAGSGTILSFIGLIHGEKVEWNANGQVALGYLFVAVVCVAFALAKVPPREPEPDEVDAEVPAPRPAPDLEKAPAPAA